MCEPTTLALATLAITATSTYMQYEEGKKSATAQQQMIEDGLAKDRAATSRQYQEIQETAMDDSQQRYRDSLVEAARLKVIGAESGLSGSTQSRIEQEARNNADTDMAAILLNSRRRNEQAHTHGLAGASQASAQLAGIRRPSALAAGLQIAGAGMDTYRAYDPDAFRKKQEVK